MKMSVKLGDVLTISRGASPRPISKYITTHSDGINWIKIGDVEPNSFYITKTEEKITPEGAQKSRLVKEGDFILSNSMSFGRPYILKINGCVHDGWLILSNYEKTLISSYLYYLLRSSVVQSQFDGSANGSTVRNLNSDIVRNVKVYIHTDKNVQKEIANRLDSIQSAIDNKNKQLSFLDEAVKSEFVEMFGNPIDNDKSFPKKRMTDVCPIQEAKLQIVSDSVWLLNLDMIEQDTGTILDKQIVSMDEVGNSTIQFSSDHVLYSKLRPYLNKVALPDESGYASSELVPFFPKKEINKIYFAYLLRSDSFVELINSKSGGAKMPRASMDFIRKFEIPVPSLDLQNQFAAFVQQIDKSKFVVKQQIADLQELLDSKMQEYFS